MISKDYARQCDVGRLTSELVASGYPKDPSDNAIFYGITCTTIEGGSFQTTILFFDDVQSSTIAEVDAIVASHIPVPLPLIVPPESPHDAENKPYVRAESRPLNCTTCFTSCGDFLGAGSIPPIIGGGNRLDWDASIADDWSTDGAPSGFKQRQVEIQFCDSTWIKEGSLYYMNAVKGSYLDMRVVCPNGGYYMYMGEVCQNTTGEDLIVEHYINKAGLQGDCPMGDELNTETCSQELPSYLKFRLTITVPISDEISNGSLLLELYRCRTVIL